jgi:L-amino acid N-acyltransferase YncA
MLVVARDAGLKEMIAEVLPENSAMLKLFRKFGFKIASQSSARVIHLALQLS